MESDEGFGNLGTVNECEFGNFDPNFDVKILDDLLEIDADVLDDILKIPVLMEPQIPVLTEPQIPVLTELQIPLLTGPQIPVLNELKIPALTDPQIQDLEMQEPKPKRFKPVSDEKIAEYQSMNQSKSTKNNTKWGLKIFQDWHMEMYGQILDTATVAPDVLAIKLSKFYAEVKPQQKSKKNEETKTEKGENESNFEIESDQIYHKNTLINIRGAINRHFSDIDRNINIVQDTEFKKSNSTLNGLFKERMITGTSKGTTHKPQIISPDLMKIKTYFERASENPLILRQCVWYNLAIHFVSRGIEFHNQLNKNSLSFHTDEHGCEYISLSHETQEKCKQGGLADSKQTSDKRMYATDTASCPVKLVKLFLEKTPKDATSLYNRCVADAISRPFLNNIWYDSTPLTRHAFKTFMPDISKYAKLSQRYTAHSIRATCIQAMTDANIQTREMMFYSGHKNDASVRSYARDLSTSQKQTISNVLAMTADPTAKPPTVSVTVADTLSGSNQIIHTLTRQVSSGVLSNSSFTNCSFSINM